jgi:phosphate-selective porin OprO/OprP
VRKKFIAAGAALVATAFIGQAASAKSLEDVLKEKGVITEADYKEVTKVKPLDYKLGKGFTFTSQDEKFQLSLGGRMQLRYTFLDNDPRTDKNGKVTDTEASTWDAKRIKVSMYGYAYTKDLTYGLQLEVRQAGNVKMLQDAFLNYKIIDEAQIKVGQYKTPIFRQELTSDGNLQLVDRSIVVDAFKPTYDIGATLNGKIANGLAYYTVGGFGGAGQTTGRTNNDNLFAARVAVNPLGDMAYSEADLDISKKPLVSIGADYFRNTLSLTTTPSGTTSVSTLNNTNSNYATASTNGWLGLASAYGSKYGKNSANQSIFANTAAGTDKVDINCVSVDAAFKWMGLSAQAEYVMAQGESQTTGNLLRAQGYYGQVGYMILPKLEAAFRYSYLDPNRDLANDHIIETIGGVSYYFDKHRLKLQADVGNIHNQGGGVAASLGSRTDDMQYRVQAQLTF